MSLQKIKSQLDGVKERLAVKRHAYDTACRDLKKNWNLKPTAKACEQRTAELEAQLIGLRDKRDKLVKKVTSKLAEFDE